MPDIDGVQQRRDRPADRGPVRSGIVARRQQHLPHRLQPGLVA
jgi:hypothetical protein